MEVNEVKKMLLMAALATTLLSACSNNKVEEEVSKNEEEKRESSAKIVERKEYIIIDKKYNDIFLKDDSSNKEDSVKVSLNDLNSTKWKAPKRNGILDIGDHISLKKEEGKYTPTLVKDLVGEIKYDGTIKYKILEATDKSVKWLPLNKVNDGGVVPPDMVKVMNASKIKGGDIVTIQDQTKSSEDAIVYELTIVK
ncbi:hypothetical protein COM04_06630 [Bacillus wiedmannii]|uniref:hypothetical protein n=1 Tax=Bacillus wiedmannii TaxID=1890302 RepID=UPI000BEC234F|nr:hypothetical protein [Bacillus wiedmannii]PEA74851.1 hypothetical protein CON92_27710 [Bacillus wiedmannii]PEG10071.1 hypothetical protein CON96_12075 [Bacillus wiedmannii]PEJ49287.1 hypothetical protein CN676_20585 [Bacillus wiedmannii]PEL36760.1 hypothetical protein CN607_28185 [Bacillus wiedmannii]PEO93615.1 hypothetical protein CN554_25220 [Bacillus wiedmannii]